jgi:hypothetical protein
MSSNPTTVTIYYPFHPLVNHALEVITWPRKPAHAATLKHPDGNAVKIPLWMLQPDAAHFHLSEQIELSASALSALVDLLALHASTRVDAQPHPEQTHAATQVHTRELSHKLTKPHYIKELLPRLTNRGCNNRLWKERVEAQDSWFFGFFGRRYEKRS